MDYGYQLLRHVVQQVFGNLGAAARITLPLLAIPVIILLITNPGLLTGEAFQFDGQTDEFAPVSTAIFGVIVAVVIGIVCWLWAAVSWHRFVLLEEYPNAVLPKWYGSNIANYFGNTILVGLIMMAAGLGFGIVIGIVGAILQNAAVLLVFGVALIFGLSWVATRIGLILPAAAIGQSLRIGESWKATAPVSGQIMLPIIVIAIVSTILNQAVIFAFGTSIPVTGAPEGTLPFAQEQIVLSMPGVILNTLVTWLQLLVNLALMTTLYGNLIEGRQLN